LVVDPEVPMPAPAPLRHIDPHAANGWLYRSYVRLVASPPMAWCSKQVGWKLDPYLLRLTGGRLGFGLMLPTALLETRGARSGLLRRRAVIYFHDDDRPTIIASKAGEAQHPGWFHNARAHPDVTLGGLPFRAEIVEDEAERARLWELADRVFPPYAAYRDRAAAAGRVIPILQLLPR
jgi:deazaflavin-dependent oxidoreductase (nitroreductase family)